MIHVAVKCQSSVRSVGLQVFSKLTLNIFAIFFSSQLFRIGIEYVSKSWKGRFIMRLFFGGVCFFFINLGGRKKQPTKPTVEPSR